MATDASKSEILHMRNALQSVSHDGGGSTWALAMQIRMLSIGVNDCRVALLLAGGSVAVAGMVGRMTSSTQSLIAGGSIKSINDNRCIQSCTLGEALERYECT